MAGGGGEGVLVGFGGVPFGNCMTPFPLVAYLAQAEVSRSLAASSAVQDIFLLYGRFAGGIRGQALASSLILTAVLFCTAPNLVFISSNT